MNNVDYANPDIPIREIHFYIKEQDRNNNNLQMEK